MAVLPALREDLQLSPAPDALDGAPQWTLVDVLAGRYFKLSGSAIRLLRHWSLGEEEQVLAAANRETGIPLGNDELQGLLRFLRANDLIVGNDEEQRASYGLKAGARRKGVLTQLLHQYLFFRIPLWRPDPFLNKSWPVLARHGGWLLRIVLPLMLLAGLYLLSRDWPRYRDSFSWLFSLEGAAAFGVTMVFAKFTHELGHAWMAKRMGCRVQSMGVAFVVMFPMFYTDVSDAWRVRSRTGRLLIGSGGMLAELILAIVALLAWSLLPEGPLRTAAFLLSSASWLTTLAVNLNPLMRFDGYFILSDWWQVDNLQGRAFALCRWRLREALFGYDEPPPQRWSPRMQRRLLLWGYASWLWRFFLFLGIALAVYHYFFKLLGIFLMAVEVSWFIALPMVREAQHWWQHRLRARRGKVLRSALGLVLILLVLFVPLRRQIEIPAQLEAGRVSTLYAPVAAQLVTLNVRDGERVQAGQLLLTLDAPDLNARLAIARQKIAILQLQLRRQAALRDTVADSLILEQQLAESLAEHRGLTAQRNRLEIRAPASGVVRDLERNLVAGRWLTVDQPLVRVVNTGEGRLRGYLEEGNLGRVVAGESGRFITDDPGREALEVQLQGVDPTASPFIEREALTSDHGGPVAVRRDAEKRPRPIQGWYGVDITLSDGQKPPMQPLRGVVVVKGKPESLFSRLWRRIAVVGIRESGF
ncbi:HlyD family efflux transporter periplasmic adaptor subunit [Phytobacter sp. V91]|uniref:HlyD family efflux transporter periplasmic adaptor subunit n=1 Tax=Phytobacter sp. V91 TaxID=3369425 RepID=UPI003F640638